MPIRENSWTVPVSRRSRLLNDGLERLGLLPLDGQRSDCIAVVRQPRQSHLPRLEDASLRVEVAQADRPAQDARVLAYVCGSDCNEDAN